MPVLALLLVAAVWGATYVVVKDAVSVMPVSDFLAWRFALAALVVFAARPRSVLRLSGSGLAVGVVAGAVLGSGYALQTVGLLTTPASVSGFLTGMLVVLTPLVAAVVLRERVSATGWAGVALATVGLALLSLRGLSVGPGEALTLGCALAFAVHIVALSRWAPQHDVHGLVVVQLATVTTACLAVAAPGGLAVPPDVAAWRGVVVTGVAATALAYLVQTWAQVRVSATRTGLLLTTEPVFAAAVGVLVADERFTGRAAAGAVLVCAAMVLSAVRRPAGQAEASRCST